MSPATKICKRCDLEYVGSNAPEEVLCAECFVTTCEVPEDVDELFEEVVRESYAPLKVAVLVRFQATANNKAKYSPRVPEVNNNDVTDSSTFTSTAEAEEQSEKEDIPESTNNNNESTRTSGVVRRNSVRDRIKALEDSIRRTASNAPEEVLCAECFVTTCEVPEDVDELFEEGVRESYAPLKGAVVLNALVRFKATANNKAKYSPRVPEVNNNDVTRDDSSTFTSTAEAEEQNEKEDIPESTNNNKENTRTSGVVRSNSVRDRIKALEDSIRRTASTGSYDRKKNFQGHREGHRQGIFKKNFLSRSHPGHSGLGK